LPKEVPGAGVPPLSLPERDPNDLTPRNEAIDRLFPELPAPPKVAPTPSGARAPMSLDAIKEMALQNSPLLQQAQADIESAIGTAVQSGTHPNPTVGYEADTVNSLGSRNYQGVFFTQLIKTGGKLELARAADNVALMNRQLALRRSRFDLLARTQANYYQVLVAQETLRATEAFVRFSNEVYRIQVDQLKGAKSTPTSPCSCGPSHCRPDRRMPRPRTATSRRGSRWRRPSACPTCRRPRSKAGPTWTCRRSTTSSRSRTCSITTPT
jgi:cobalt-zinc-cadmium efflux system outer membrane protein